MEKNRIYHAALGGIIAILSIASISGAQDNSPDSSFISRPVDVTSDTTRDENKADSTGKIAEGIFNEDESDSVLILTEQRPVEWDSLHAETINPTAYYRRTYLAKGMADELKGCPDIFIQSAGPVGSPQIPLHYLNVPGIEIIINNHPFLYNDIYRPYRIGSDLNAVPWEILNEVFWNDENSLDNRIHLEIGRPAENANRSDVEVFRGPYGYNANRWRFFRPFNDKTYGYFTVGFKKSGGYLQNSDYDAFHVTGGGSRWIYGGLLKMGAWKYRSKSGVNSFDFLTPQLFRHSRTTHRYEVSYSREIRSFFDFSLSGMYQKNGLIAKYISSTFPIDSDIGGGTASIGKGGEQIRIDLGASYYRLRTYKLARVKPAVNVFEYSGKLSGEYERFEYRGNIIYSWNGEDLGAFLPAAFVRYDLNRNFEPFISISRSRRLPDLNLTYFSEEIGGLGYPDLLETYRFESYRNLNSPVTTRLNAGTEIKFNWLNWEISASYVRIKNQIYLSYQSDTVGVNTVSPANFDDELLEICGNVDFRYGPFDSELGGAFRKWKERYFRDGLEKGPAVIGFGRLSASKSFFFEDLFLGGSLEFRAASRQDYRSIRPAFLDWFGILNGRLEFRYKDFIFWWNDDNITNNNYTTWWPYPETPRMVWWGFRWRFYD